MTDISYKVDNIGQNLFIQFLKIKKKTISVKRPASFSIVGIQYTVEQNFIRENDTT